MRNIFNSLWSHRHAVNTGKLYIPSERWFFCECLFWDLLCSTVPRLGFKCRKMLWAQQSWNNKCNLTLSNSAFRIFIGRDLKKRTRNHNSANSFYHCSTFCPRSKLFTSAMTQQKLTGWIPAPLLLLVGIMKHPVECYKKLLKVVQLYIKKGISNCVNSHSTRTPWNLIWQSTHRFVSQWGCEALLTSQPSSGYWKTIPGPWFSQSKNLGGAL